MEKISWTDHVRNEEVLLQINERRNILHAIRKRKANWIGHILRRNCLLKQVTEGKVKGEIEVTRRQGRRRKKLLDDLKDRRESVHLKEEALGRNTWRDHFGTGFEPDCWMMMIVHYSAVLMRQLLRRICSAGQYMCTKLAFVFLYRTQLAERKAVKRIMY